LRHYREGIKVNGQGEAFAPARRASDTIARVKPELQAALANGAVVVTANRRQARLLQREFAANAVAQARQTWPTPSILSHEAWLQTLWLDALAADAIPDAPRMLTTTQAAYAWQKIVGRDTARSAPLIDSRGAAALAGEAWKLMHAWGAGGESWRGWPRLAMSEDQLAYVSWAESYSASLADARSVDDALLPDLLARQAAGLARARNLDIVFAGFVEETPQQLRLAQALADAGASISRFELLPAEQGRAQRFTAATAGDELAHALAWARSRVTARADALVGIAVADLSTRRVEARAIAEDVLCPSLQWPGRELEPRPFNISLGGRLSDEPLIGVALDLLALGQAVLPIERAATAMRSPYLVGAAAMWGRRAGLELTWLEEGRREISLNDILLALPKLDASLAERWRGASAALRVPQNATPREWTDRWRDWLSALGWPGDRALDSAEYQAREAWDELLRDFGAIGAVESRLSKTDALSLLRSLATETLYQPESSEASVQILGLLEAQGLAFDALWIAGLGAERWPPAPEPNALLPVEWQRERDLPRSSAARELRFARELTRRLRSAAPDVVLSYVRGSEDDVDAPSALILDAPEIAADAIVSPVTTARALFARRPALEAIADESAPSLPPGTRARGGAGLFEKQSDCPFRAVAIHRLRADCWPRPIEGVSPLEHGSLVHAALAEFWSELEGSDALRNLSDAELGERVGGAVAKVCEATLPPFRWRAMPPLIADGERERVANIVREWLLLGDRERPSFRVLETELKLPLQFGGLGVEVRLDRVDALEHGGVAVLDYKTGLVVAPSRWFDTRPRAPQLGLYALAWLAARPGEPVRAVAYAQLRRGELKVEGLAADGVAWPELEQPNELDAPGLVSWADVDKRWRASLGALADEIQRGRATVTPRKPSETCKRCGLQPLCRIGARGLVGSDDNGAEAIDED
jgi:probable DNA repair protein